MNFKSSSVLFLSVMMSAGAVSAEESKWQTPTMVNARAGMLDPRLNYLTFQHMDQLFATRNVAAGGKASALQVATRSIGDEFNFEGKTQKLSEFLESTSTNALLVMKDGKIVQEIYRNGSTDKTRFMSFSMAKSITSTLVGLAAAEGKIKSLDDKVIDYLPDWKNSAYANVSIRDLLRMRSGIDWQEIYEFGSKTQLTEVHDNSLVGYKYRWCDYARDRAKTLKAPGEAFNYSTLDTSVLGCVLEAAIGGKGADYFSEKIWKPAGMESDGFFLLDGPENVGREFYGAGYNAVLRDYGRFGQLILDKGKVNGKQILPEKWVDEATAAMVEPMPADQELGLGYGYQWWTLLGSDAFSAIGLYNQYIFIDPSDKVVIVKLDAPAAPLGWDKANLDFFKQVVTNLAKK
ncbi:serine hydrolase domain-containing protein [Rhizobium helianthi]|uniref:Serine hydrolase domain-containing protein n=1 Tax=Rhizobium helianthi TaxID=1132695 RepID=A0ABW4M4U7_9HYPH